MNLTKETSMKKASLVEAVRAHANAHYAEGGWDVIVEAWDDSQILDCVKDCTTKAQAIQVIKQLVSVYADRQADAESYEETGSDFEGTLAMNEYMDGEEATGRY
jgi:hypothetical protein